MPIASRSRGLGYSPVAAVGVTAPIGITNTHSPVIPATDSPEDHAMAQLFDLVHNRVYADPVLLGHYPEAPEFLGAAFSAFDAVPAEDLAIISQPLDFYGLNYYMPTLIAAGAGTGESPDGSSQAMTGLPFHLLEFEGAPQTAFGWPIKPDGFAQALAEVHERYGDSLPPVFITENGASFHDEVGEYGTINDEDRIAFVHDHLAAALAAVAPGGLPRASTCAGSSCGHCSTTGSGRPGSRRGSAWCTSISRPASAPPRHRILGYRRCSQPGAATHSLLPSHRCRSRPRHTQEHAWPECPSKFVARR